LQVIEPNVKRTKKRAMKAVGEDQPAASATKTLPTGGYLWSRDEEELVDYEPEEPMVPSKGLILGDEIVIRLDRKIFYEIS
jgi:hypothetical protein